MKSLWSQGIPDKWNRQGGQKHPCGVGTQMWQGFVIGFVIMMLHSHPLN